jgi:hypothetical protein
MIIECRIYRKDTTGSLTGKILLASADTIPDDFVQLLVILVGCCSMQSNNRLSEAEEKD